MSAAIRTALAPFPAKRIAKAANAHPKTCERWRRGEAVPCGAALVDMMRADDEIFAALLRAAGRSDHAARATALRHMTLALAAMADSA
jgi:hypothetical protein